jgi:NAD(P)-dependent dehydrogenase (short-subunit alcohol dehydrogenase family)
VTIESMVQSAVAAAAGDENRLDVAVNSAGYDGSAAMPTSEWTSEMLNEMLTSDARGTFLPMKYELEMMHRQGSGAIVNIGSGAGLLGVPGHSGYVASKHAGIGLTRSAALEYAAEGIRVDAVAPGRVDTPLIHNSAGELYDYIQPLIASHPIGRIARPEEIADTVVWLASEKASYVTGVALPVDGGYAAA